MSASRVTISQACGECRARKIKCDLQQPSCARCTKSGRQCPGYRDQLALWFRDESQTVARRTKATTHSSPSAGRRTQKSLMEEAFEKALMSTNKPSLFLLPIDIFMVDVQDRASCYFFEVFDWVGASNLIEGSFDYKRDSTNAPLGEQALLAGITAVGKASLANLHQSNSLKEPASDDYFQTISLVNTALSDSEQLKEDSTLIAIFLLSIFEIIVGKETKCIGNWMNHIIGASNLLESREIDDLSKTSSPEMFYCLRNAIVVCCICRRKPMPSIIVRLSNQMAVAMRDPLSAALRDLTVIIADLANIRYKIDTGEMSDPKDILKQLESIESGLEKWVGDLSPSCYYDILPTPRPFQITPEYSLPQFQSRSHKYPKFWVANMWNEFRTTKFQIHDMMLTYLRPWALESESARMKCFSIRKHMAQISEEICCSVPYVLGLLANEQRDTSHPTVRSSCGGFVLIWPLAVAALTQSSPTTSEFAFKCLELISSAMGIHLAAIFRDWVPSSSKYTWIDSM